MGNEKPMSKLVIDKDLVRYCLSLLESNKSAGPDGLKADLCKYFKK